MLIFQIVNSRISPTYYSCALAAVELIMFKRGILHVNNFSFEDFSIVDAFLKPFGCSSIAFLLFLFCPIPVFTMYYGMCMIFHNK